MVPVSSWVSWVGLVGAVPNTRGIDVVAGVTGSAVSAFLTTLLVGAILVALAPAYTQRQMDAVREDVVGSFLFGFAALVAVILVAFLLAITIVGILVAIPFVVLAILVWAVGAAIAYLAIAERLVDTDEGWVLALVVAATINGGLTLTGVGGIVAFAVGATGFGAVLRDWLE